MELSEDEIIINLKYLKAAFFDAVVNTAHDCKDSMTLRDEVLLLHGVFETVESFLYNINR